MKKAKMPKFGTKNASFGYFLPKMSCLGSFWLGFWKSYCHICIKHLWICLNAKLGEQTKKPKFWDQKRLIGYFWARIFKIYCRIWNKHPRSSVTARFFQEMKLPKFGTKNALFWYFWPKVSYLATFGPQL